ncbi:hypothetical protein SAMN02787142_3853 [Burkholderia sp. WP9]|jgi:hypothetical protein|uniref:hypothetical protein n=1 Tax=Burkholderia sp. WP9 TaxID=1500263 RepID=UPI00089D8215|nr:hypothetical protein [Burkholderia sp. WP9]SED79427.1 hypothetical protein SAMN02787142_3853 [Burkholderia sp. WP9]
MPEITLRLLADRCPMTNNRALKSVIFPEPAAEGYFVHARYGDEQLMSPEAVTFYVELKTAIALGLAWVNDRCENVSPARQAGCECVSGTRERTIRR